MTNQDFQKQLKLFKSQMKEVNESLCGFESQFEQEKAKIEKLRHSFCMITKLINHELLSSINDTNEILKKFKI